MTTGASPISAEVIDFMRICFGATVIEGYGMTETACTISMTLPEDTSSGHVGGPLPCCEVKLEDIPEMGYTNGDRPYPRGEVRSYFARQQRAEDSTDSRQGAVPCPSLPLAESPEILVIPIKGSLRARQAVAGSLGSEVYSEVLRVKTAGVGADLRAWADGVPGVLQGRGADAGDPGRGRLAAHGRHRPLAARRPPQDHRPQEEHLQARPGLPCPQVSRHPFFLLPLCFALISPCPRSLFFASKCMARSAEVRSGTTPARWLDMSKEPSSPGFGETQVLERLPQ